MEKLQKIESSLTKICVFFRRIGMLALCGMIAVICFDVFMRFIFNKSMIWAYDMSWILSATVAACCLASAHLIDSNICVDVISARLPKKVQLISKSIINIFIGIPVFVYLDVEWVKKTITGIETLERSSHTSTWYPLLWPVRLIGTIGLSLFLIIFLFKIAKDIVALLIEFKRGREEKTA